LLLHDNQLKKVISFLKVTHYLDILSTHCLEAVYSV